MQEDRGAARSTELSPGSRGDAIRRRARSFGPRAEIKCNADTGEGGTVPTSIRKGQFDEILANTRSLTSAHIQQIIDAAKVNGDAAEALVQLAEKRRNLFKAEHIANMIEAAKANKYTAEPLSELVMSRPELFKAEHIPCIIEAAGVNGDAAEALVLLAERRPKLFKAEHIPGITEVSKVKEAAWALAYLGKERPELAAQVLSGIIEAATTNENVVEVLEPQAKVQPEWFSAEHITGMIKIVIKFESASEAFERLITNRKELFSSEHIPGLIEAVKVHKKLITLEFLAAERPDLARQIFSALLEPAREIPQLREHLIEIAMFKDIRTRLEMLKELAGCYPLNVLSLDLVSCLLRRMPHDALTKYAISHPDAALAKIARYHESHLPWDEYFWGEYLPLDDPSTFLKETQEALKEYRRGKPISRRPNLREMRLVYAGLDGPEDLTFAEFQKRMGLEYSELPPMFLDSGFTASVTELVSVHAQIDKGKITQAIEPIKRVRTVESLKKYLVEFVGRAGGALRRLRPEFEAMAKAIADIESDNDRENKRALENISLTAVAALEKAAAEKPSPPVKELIDHIILYLAAQSEAGRTLLRRMDAFGTRASSETVVDALHAAEEFYRDVVQDILSANKTTPTHISLIAKHRKLLAAELMRIKPVAGKEIQVEFVPSKGHADKFFGWIGEDCTKDKADSIKRGDFQVYRMVAGETLSGMLYVQKAVLDGKKVLVMAIQPRSFWQIDHQKLLRVIEENFGKIGAENGYDYVLLMGNNNQQSNRVDMLKAIKDRKYEQTSFSNAVQGTVFFGKNFLVMWKRPKKSDQI